MMPRKKRIALAEDKFIKDYNENFSQVQTALTEMPFNLTEVKVFKISERWFYGKDRKKWGTRSWKAH